MVGFDRATPEDGRLLDAIAQLPQALESNPVYAWYRLPKLVLHKAQQLVHLLGDLRSPQSGWPAHLAYTEDNLTPYVAEEAYELLEALKQLALSRRGGLTVAAAEPLHLVDWQLRQMDLATLRSQLLWEIASSGHGVMQLLQGLSAQVAGQTVRLYLAVGLQTDTSTVDLNGPVVGQTVAGETPLHLDGETLTLNLKTAEELLAQISQTLERNPILERFLHRQAVQLLQPGQPWRQTFLKITLRLVTQAAGSDASPLLPDTAVPAHDEDETEFVLPMLPGLDLYAVDDAAALDAADLDAADLASTDPDADSLASAADPTDDWVLLTADDLALALTGSTAKPPQADTASATSLHNTNGTRPDRITAQTGSLQRNGSRSANEAVNGAANGAAGSQVLAPSPVPADPERLIPAWITVTDDRWIASLSEMVARQQLIAELPLKKLLEQLGQPQVSMDAWLPQVIAAACTATDRAMVTSGLFHQNFFQQAVYLEDMLPQLLWYVYRASAVTAQLIGGIPARFLAPDQPWQTGQLRLLTTLQLRTRQRKMMVDLAAATPLAYPVQRLPRDGVVQSQALPLMQQPYTVAQLETRLYRLLRQATPELDWLLRGTPLELHLLEPVNEPERQVGAMQLGLGLQFVATPTTVMGEVVG